MNLKYSLQINSDYIKSNLKKITNQIYKLLPNREEGIDWVKPLETIMEELTGMNSLFIDQQAIFFSLLCKLEGLFSLKGEKDFGLFRRTIFECLGLISEISKKCLD